MERLQAAYGEPLAMQLVSETNHLSARRVARLPVAIRQRVEDALGGHEFGDCAQNRRTHPERRKPLRR